jgi:hypothetical protein
VLQNGLARLPCTGKTETKPAGDGFKDQPDLVQHSATPELRNGASFERFGRFGKDAIIAFVHAALVCVCA